jgi:uncharacterized membrane protein
MKKRVQWLFRELDQWVHEGIIGNDQAQAIRQRYPAPEDGVSWGRMTFAVTGSVLIGLGVILFFAFNWSGMHKFAKLGVIFTALAASHGAALAVNRNGLRETLHVLGTMIFGSGIWLVAQIYHIEEHYPNGIFVWALAALALAWVLPSIPQALLAAILLIVWNGFEALRFRSPLYLAPALVAIGTLPLAMLLRSRVLTAAGLTAFLVSLVFMLQHSYSFFQVPLFLSLAAAFIGAGIVFRRDERAAAPASIFIGFGMVLFYVLLFSLTFSDVSRHLADSFRGWQHGAWYIVATVLAVALWAVALFPYGSLKERLLSSHEFDYLVVPAVLVLVLVSSLRAFGVQNFLPWTAYNLLFLASVILLMMRGFRTGRQRLVVTGCLLFAAYALARYTDLFYSLLARSAVFLVMGGVMIGVGYFFKQSRKPHAEAEL